MHPRFLDPERFWAHVDKSGDCWLWTASTTPMGYGQVMRSVNGKHINRHAHRVAWAIANGPIPVGMCVLHKCDVMRCVNPAHLFLGTKADNTADMMRKGRGRYRHGEDSGAAKLTAKEVSAIREAHANGEGVRAIGRRVGVDSSHVSKIVRRKAWKTA